MLRALTGDELSTLHTTIVRELPAGLNDADVTLVDRTPNVTVFVDVGGSVTRAQVIAVVTSASFMAAITEAMGMLTRLVDGPYMVSSHVVVLQTPAPPRPPLAPPPPALLTIESSSEANTAEASASVSAGAIAAVVCSVVGIVVLLLVFCAWRRMLSNVKADGENNGVRLLSPTKGFIKVPADQKSHSPTDRSSSSMEPSPVVDAHHMLDLNLINAAVPPCELIALSREPSALSREPSALSREPSSICSTPKATVDRFRATIRHNSAGQFRIQLIQEKDAHGREGGDISISLVGESDVVDDRANVAEGDVLREINGEDIAGKSIHAVQKMLTGSGAQIELTLERTRGKPTNVMRITVETVEVQGIEDDDDDNGLSTDRRSPKSPSTTPRFDDTIVQGGAFALVDAGRHACAPPGTPTELYSPENASSNLSRLRREQSLGDDTIVQGGALTPVDAGLHTCAPPGTPTELYSPENAGSNLSRLRHMKKFDSAMLRI